MIVHWDMHYPDAPRTDGGPSTTAGRKTVSYDVFAQLVGEQRRTWAYQRRSRRYRCSSSDVSIRFVR